MFSNFPPEILQFISKKHCVITGHRERKAVKGAKKESPQKDQMIAETLCMQDLLVALPKRRKNPSILVNGEKVVDSDIEEKKERRAHNSSGSKNFLTVNGPSGK
jgi:hypothetical protein